MGLPLTEPFDDQEPLAQNDKNSSSKISTEEESHKTLLELKLALSYYLFTS